MRIVPKQPFSFGNGVEALSVRTTVRGNSTDYIAVTPGSRQAYLDELGIPPNQLTADLRSGRAAELASDHIATRNGWQHVGDFTSANLNAPGIDRVFRTQDGTHVVVEAKVHTGSGRLSHRRLRSEVDGQQQYQLSDEWLRGEGAGPDYNPEGISAIARSQDAGKLEFDDAQEL